MKFRRIENQDGSIEFRIDGAFEGFFYSRLKNQVEADIAEGKASFFIFDLSKTDQIDSMAISILVLTGKYNSDKGKKLKIRNAPVVIREIIRSADLNFVEYI